MITNITASQPFTVRVLLQAQNNEVDRAPRNVPQPSTRCKHNKYKYIEQTNKSHNSQQQSAGPFKPIAGSHHVDDSVIFSTQMEADLMLDSFSSNRHHDWPAQALLSISGTK